MNSIERKSDVKVIPIHRIHSTAIVHPDAQLGADIEIGPYAIIGEHVTIGDGTKIGPHTIVEGWTSIGVNNRIYSGAVIGNDPMDLKYKGEKSYLFLGDNNIIREYATISRGTEGGGGETRIGSNNLIMSNVHIAHDCQIGNNIVISHGTGVAGHVTIEDDVRIGGIVGIHQFCKLGRLSFVGAHSMITKDVPPFMLVDGDPARMHGPNVEGLRRSGYTPEQRLEIQRAYRMLYRSGLGLNQAIEAMENQLAGNPEIDHLLRFLRSAGRGITR